MNEITIESGVPMPEVKRGRNGGKSLYPFSKLEVGDSFFVPVNDDDAKQRRKVNAKLSTLGRAHGLSKAGAGKKFKTRVVDGGVRVWRVE